MSNIDEGINKIRFNHMGDVVYESSETCHKGVSLITMMLSEKKPDAKGRII